MKPFHTHRWRRLHEQALLGGSFSIGWECSICGEFVSNNELTPTGIEGIVLKKAARLVGPHGGYGTCTDGSAYKEQIINEDGELQIVRK